MKGETELYEELAKTVVRDALKIESSDVVTITTWDHTVDLANALAVECFRRGADAMMSLWTDEYYYGLLRELSEESLEVCSKICEAFNEAETAIINIFGPKNPEGLKNIPVSKINAWGEGERKAHHPRMTERKIRQLSLPLALLTPERAEVYGFNLENWKKAVNAALAMDLKKIDIDGRKLAAVLEGAQMAHLTAPNGTDLSFRLDHRPVHVDDGIIDEKDMEKGSLHAQLPAGSVVTTVSETSGDGKVIFDQPLQTTGLTVQGLQFEFKEGKVTSLKAKSNTEVLSKPFQASSGDKNKIGFLQIGVNPRAEYGYLMDHIVEGAVQIGIGDNSYIGGKNNSPFGIAATLSRATLDVDGRIIIKNGRLFPE